MILCKMWGRERREEEKEKGKRKGERKKKKVTLWLKLDKAGRKAFGKE
jgi:hypothetical protein